MLYLSKWVMSAWAWSIPKVNSAGTEKETWLYLALGGIKVCKVAGNPTFLVAYS